MKGKSKPKRGTKKVNGATYVKKDDVWMLNSEGPSSRKNSWVTLSQIEREFPEFIDKIADILFGKYTPEMQTYARNILTWLELWKFVSWKQFDSIIRICDSYAAYKRSMHGSVQVVEDRGLVSVKNRNVTYTYRGKSSNDWSERKVDQLHETLFGFAPMFEEEIEFGAIRKYRSDGSRYFAFPSGEEKLSDYLHFGVNFFGINL